VGPRWAALELGAAALVAALAAVLGPRPELIGFGWLAAAGVGLAAVDVAVRRLPDRLTAPAYAVLLASFALGAATGTDPARLRGAVLGGLALAGLYFLLAFIRPGQLGLGDVKLAGLLGLALGWAGWPALILGASLAFVLAAVASLGLLAARRLTLRSHIAFGPFMLLGAALALLG
jgi:leader peptidase (prepilin peptidase)/N-methyltransferase